MASDESPPPEAPLETSANDLRAVISLSGPPAAVAALIERLAAYTALSVHVTGELRVAEDGWERLPRPLTAKERAIVERDLRGEPRRLIAEQLGLTADTVTVYRRLIRAKFRTLPSEERPLWMLAWLRRFPGLIGS